MSLNRRRPTLTVSPPGEEIGALRTVELEFSAAQLIASDTTPLVLVQNADAKKILVFHGGSLEIVGGSTNYDQNQNFIVKYQTAGGGSAVSTTVANLMNAGAAGTLKTIKPITTDYTPEAGQDLVLTSSASPYSAAGDRKLFICFQYSVINVRS